MENLALPMFAIEPNMVVDEVSSTEIYVGVSNSFKDYTKPVWKIKKIWKSGSVWEFGYPNGNQEFMYIWDDRYSYTYK